MRPDAILKELTAMTRLLEAPRVLWLCGFAATLPVQGCVNDLLQVTDPDVITEEQLKANSAAGAVSLHNGNNFPLWPATSQTPGPDALFAVCARPTGAWA